MSASLLSQAHWRPFLLCEGLHDVPAAILVVTDDFLTWLRRGTPRQPSPVDYMSWASRFSEDAPDRALAQLSRAFEIIMPSEIAQIAEAGRRIQRARASTISVMAAGTATAALPKPAVWDPCAASRSSPRRLSVQPSQLPETWKSELRRAAAGLPGGDAPAPAPAILTRMLEKLCQYVWSCRKACCRADFSAGSVDVYLDDLEGRLSSRPGGIRWATLRATVEELERFLRYGEFADAQAQDYLRHRLYRYAAREKAQDAQKFTKLFETGNTVLTVLAHAEKLIAEAALQNSPAARHRLRSAGVILALSAVLGLRNANSNPVFGVDLFWEAGTWCIDTEIVKTRASNGERLTVPLRAEFSRYVDIAVLGDEEQFYLPGLREKACATRRALILRADSSIPHPTYVARIFKQHTGNSLTTTRTMLHTDQAIRRGEAGTRDTMQVLHQRSRRVAEKYQGRAVRQAAIQRVQAHVADCQADAFDEEQHTALAALRGRSSWRANHEDG